jgi:hypothetical protein
VIVNILPQHGVLFAAVPIHGGNVMTLQCKHGPELVEASAVDQLSIHEGCEIEGMLEYRITVKVC